MLKSRCDQIAKTYNKDLDYDDLFNECKHLKPYIALDETCDTLHALYNTIISENF